MTEKQYHVQKIYKGMNDGVKIYDWCVMNDDEIILRLTTRMDCKYVVEVLNKLAEGNEELRTKNNAYLQDIEVYREENEQLKHECNYLQNRLDDFINIQNENEQLKSTINTITHDNTKMKKVLNTTKKENEHIKQVIKEAYNNERTQIGKNTLKQLMETIQ